MSEWGKVPREVFLDDRLTRRDLRVLGILCTHADGRTGICTRKQEAIAEEIGSDRSGVNRSIAKLVQLGYVDTHQRAGMKRSLQYRVLVREASAGQMSLFDTREAPRQAKPRAAKRAEKGTSVVPSESTSVVPSSGTSNKQTPDNRSYAAARVVPANDEPMLAPMPDAVPVREADPARPTLDDFAAGAVRMRRPNLEAQGADAVPPGASGEAAERDRARFADLRRRLQAASGGRVVVTAFLNPAEALGWIAAGCDLEADILPTIEGLCARQRGGVIRSWSYFAEAVAEARDRRLAALNRPPKPAAGTIVPFEPNGAPYDQPSHAAAGRRPGRFAAAAELRRRQLAGDDAGGA